MKSSLEIQLINSEEYRNLYVGYKAKIEKRNIPLSLIRSLPSDIAMEVLIQFEKEKTGRSSDKKT